MVNEHRQSPNVAPPAPPPPGGQEANGAARPLEIGSIGRATLRARLALVRPRTLKVQSARSNRP